MGPTAKFVRISRCVQKLASDVQKLEKVLKTIVNRTTEMQKLCAPHHADDC